MNYPKIKIPQSLRGKNGTEISFKIITNRNDSEVLAEGTGEIIIFKSAEDLSEAYISVSEWPKGVTGKATFHHIPLSQRLIDLVQISEAEGSLHLIDPLIPKDVYDHQ